MTNHRLLVSQKASGQTLLAFLRANLDSYSSVKAIKRAIDAKQCKINSQVETFSTHPLKTSDLVEIVLEVKKQELPTEVLFEDETLVIYNKPPGKSSESFHEHFMVHRLDKDTSGVIIFAKTKSCQDQMIELFANREMEKTYLAICDGKPAQEQWKVDNFLEKKASYDGGSIYGSTTSGKGKRAISQFKRLKAGATASLVEVQILTGRTHQVRVHLKEKGHPILGDWQYGRNFKCPFNPSRQMLHALQISFLHPLTKEKITVKAPLFDDFLEMEKNLFEDSTHEAVSHS